MRHIYDRWKHVRMQRNGLPSGQWLFLSLCGRWLRSREFDESSGAFCEECTLIHFQYKAEGRETVIEQELQSNRTLEKAHGLQCGQWLPPTVVVRRR